MTRRIVPLIVLLALAGVFRWQLKPVDVVPAGSLDNVPMQLGGWQGRRGADYQPQVLAALGVDDYMNRGYYAEGGTQANVYVGYHRSQKQGASLHSPLNCLPGAGWEPERVELVSFDRGTARRVVIRKGSERLLVLYWYQTASRIEGDEYRGRFFAVLDTIRHGRNDAALVRVIVPLGPGAEGEIRAIRELAELASLVKPHVEQTLFAPASPEPAARVSAIF